MAGRVPNARKPAELLRRTNRPEEWTALPPEGCKLRAPKWPAGKASAVEAALWRDLWASPIAAWWHDQHVAPNVVARYVSLSLAKPELGAVSRLENDLGLTPAAMVRLRLVVQYPESERERVEDPYAKLRSVS